MLIVSGGEGYIDFRIGKSINLKKQSDQMAILFGKYLTGIKKLRFENLTQGKVLAHNLIN